MRSTAPLFCCLLVVVLLSACKPHEAIYRSDADLSGGTGEPLLPRGLSMSYDEELTKGRVSGKPDLSQLTTLAIRNVPLKAMKLVRADSWQRLPAALFLPEQAEEINGLLGTMQPVIDKMVELNTVANEKFKDHPAAAGIDQAAMIRTLAQMARTVFEEAEITVEEEDYAIMDLQIDPTAMQLPGMPPAAGGAEPMDVAVEFVLEEGAWRIALPFFPPSEVFAEARSTLEGQLPTVVEQLDSIRQQVESGAISDPNLLGPSLTMPLLGLQGAAQPIVMHVQSEMVAAAEEEAAENAGGEEDEAGEDGEDPDATGEAENDPEDDGE